MSVPPGRQARIFHPTYLRLLCLHLQHRGVPIAKGLAGTGMTWRQLLHETRMIPFGPVRTLILAAKELTQSAALGLEFGISVEAISHGLAGAAIAASRDVSQALESVANYRPLRGRAVEFEHIAREDSSSLLIHEPFDFGDVRSFILEAHAGIIERAMRTVTGEPLVGIEYRFPYPSPPWSLEYSRCLGGSIRFGAACMEVRVPKHILGRSSVVADVATRAGIVQSAERELDLLRNDDNFAARIRRRLIELESGYPTAEKIAQEFNMSRRTLLRRLKHEGVNYQGLLDDTRKESAEWYLLKTTEPIEAIAERLGYADPSSFGRTFRRWFKKSPGKYRKDAKGI
ncbi:MAG TPA: AraC family transcriptional regulator ligand-binding domain-containing protein [Stellaceae bacterium]|nr:AraC family transcriptional regulator ligand-binding domain-containing protein [Stellaceae bacterium]